MSSTNRGALRERDDFYETPAWASELILAKLEPLGRFDRIIEPACGCGAIIDRLIKHNVPPSQITGVEIDAQRAIYCRTTYGCEVIQTDALNATFTSRHPLVITNPPFMRAIEFVKMGIAVVANGGVCAMLLRLAFVESIRRRSFHQEHPSHIYVLTKRPSFTDDGKTDSAAYAWFVWGDGLPGTWEVL